MPLLGGLFARNNSNGNGATPKSKSSPSPSDLSPPASNYAYSASSTHLSPVPSSQASPTSDLAYAGEPTPNAKRGGMGFFGRKRSTNGLTVDTVPVPSYEQHPPKPAYLSRLSTSSDVPSVASASVSMSPNSLRPPANLYSSSTRSLPPPMTGPGASPYAHHPPQPRSSSSASPSRDRDQHQPQDRGRDPRQRYPGLSPLAPQVSPTRSTASGWTAASGKTSKSVGTKSGRKFAFWSRSKGKDGEGMPPSPSPSTRTGRTQPPSPAKSDFNLRAFRHVRGGDGASSPSRSQPQSRKGSAQYPPQPPPQQLPQQQQHQLTATNLSSLTAQIEREAGRGAGAGEEYLPPARPRPRGGSDASAASSSRISVAAFREAQARERERRSAAGSPVLGESAREPSPGPYGRRPMPSPVQVPSATRTVQPTTTVQKSTVQKKSTGTKQQQPHQRSAAAGPGRWESDEDEDEDEESHQEEEESSDDYRGAKAKPAAVSASSLGVYGPMAAKLGGSTGNLVGSASAVSVGGVATHAKRLSLSQEPLSTVNPSRSAQNLHLQQPKSPIRQPPPPDSDSSESDSSSGDSDEDSDDAPLATLVAPKRPGSSMSLRSNGSNPSLPGGKPKPKPLIDINELAGSRPVLAGQKRSDEGFTGGGMLGTTTSGMGKGDSPIPSPVLTSRGPPPPSSGRGGFVSFPSPPGSPVSETPPVVVASVVAASAAPTPVQRASPMRKDSAPVVSLGAATGKRDVLSDRLKAVAAVSSASSSSENLALALPKATPRPPPPTSFSSSATTTRKALHRRSSSDIVSAAAAGRGRSWLDDFNTSSSNKADDGDLGKDLADMLGGGGLAFVLGEGEGARMSVIEREEWAPPTNKAPTRSRSPPTTSATAPPAPQPDSIVPIVIKQRSPPPAFSVTSRPANRNSTYSEVGSTTGSVVATATTNATARPNPSTTARPRSSTLIPSSSSSEVGARTVSTTSASTASSAVTKQRQRSSTLMASGTSPSTATSTPSRPLLAQPKPKAQTLDPPRPIAQPTPSPSPPSLLGRPAPPQRPFAAVRGNSPASSSSGSGPIIPLTPRDGSDIGSSSGNSGSGSGRYPVSSMKPASPAKTKAREWSGGASGLLPAQRRSVSFDFDEPAIKGKLKAVPVVDEEQRRRERRRSEAKAAIELGNIVNGPGPVPDDDSDDDVPITQTRNGSNLNLAAMNPAAMGMNPQMGMGMGMPMMPPQMPMGMQMPMQPMWPQMQMGMQPQAMLSPGQFMMSPPSDPNLMAAHQQAMLYAKQAYQMAVAQQAMAAAGEEWERGSTMGGGRAPSVFGGSMSVVGGMGGGAGAGQGALSPFGMGLAMLNAQNSGSPMMFPSGPRSMMGGMGGGARSEYGGGGGGGGNWNSSKSVYGESFGPSTERYSSSPRTMSSGNLAAMGGGPGKDGGGYFAGAIPPSSSRPGPSPGGQQPRQRTASQPASPARGVRKSPGQQPPSSWKAAGGS
ncbi:hypothetical protein HMN09_00368700 [Mycena chlorophos]|uniref:Uncharacterized protein n=1 Tax=Mycena chlorophos TaxID=658473 RepID=A0A8H6TKU8_MYCCL|nr:hypothetical protein HMN09_00368700 [Mycena chlorophos]